jgi:hypothetical protein
MRESVGSDAGGFTFDLCKRNAYLADKGVKAPGVWKTGTTIAGVVYKARCRVPFTLLWRLCYAPVLVTSTRPAQ